MTPPAKPDFRRVLPILIVDGVFAIAIVVVMVTGRASQPVFGSFQLLHVLVAGLFVASSAVTLWRLVLPAMRAKRAQENTVWERKD